MKNKKRKIKVSFVIPCLNEEEAIGKCVKQIHNLQLSIFKNKTTSRKEELCVEKEIIVVDNGSTDKSAEVARKSGAIVIKEERKGYGRALRSGMEKATGDVIVFADGDSSYDFSESEKLINLIVENQTSDTIVVGSRMKGKIKKGAMPFFHRYVGTPILNHIFSLFLGLKISDVNSGFRALSKDSFKKLSLQTNGMEFATEMIFKAFKLHFNVVEVPISYSPRKGESKLTPFRDAWRHIKFLLLFSPTFLYLVPGIFFILLGGILMVWLLPGKQFLFGRYFDIHTLIVSSFLVLVGFQIVFLGMFSKVFAFNYFFPTDHTTLKMMKFFSLEKGLIVGLILFMIGIVGLIYIIWLWSQSSFNQLDASRMLIFDMTALVLGVQIIFSSFFFGLIGQEER